MSTQDHVLRLLVVDDDDVYREMVRRFVRAMDYESVVDEVDSVERALVVLEQSAYDCVVLDYMLGDGDAFNVLEFLHQRDDAPPVIMLTAMDDTSTAVRAMKLGVHDFLNKDGVTAQSLEAAIQRAMKTNRLATEALEYREALERMSFYDTLTGLPNRNLFFDRLGQLIRSSERSGRRFALLLMDLDLFKSVNDVHGHDAGDAVLCEAGRRMVDAIRDSDTVARLGGDEFAALLDGADSIDGAIVVAEKIAALIDAPIAIENAQVNIGISIGIALFPEHGDEAMALIKSGDRAMYEAKRAGKPFAIYEQGVHRSERRTNSIATALRAKDVCDNLELCYQPKIDLSTRAVIGAEALVRWNHPELGLLPPVEFIPAAERTDAILLLTRTIVEQALAQRRAWFARGIELPVSVNLSPALLEHAEFPDLFTDLVNGRGLALDGLTLEVNESAMLNDFAASSAALTALHGLGIKIAIDDFGTGLSSFQYLRDFAVDEIKIDRLFIRDLSCGSRDRAIVQAIINLVADLGILVTAEGIESRGTWQLLADMGCTAGQGFHLARPMPPAELAEWHLDWTADAISARESSAAA